MSHVRWMAIVVLTIASATVAAQEKSRSMNLSNPAAQGSSLRYESAFDNYQPMQEQNEMPDNV